MKKFLSLVLAMIMTMSLVTISAGATEYRDLTDKDEIQYEEAVAVLNRIGVITGYDDGSFQPERELTRGAAAKIIVSLLIGPEAASNLPNQTAPYPDVPASHTFAGVISYCKTAGIISGYGDGTFKPGNSLTGFAFAKMLLGALGYKSEIEGFVDTGWTMNVAKVGNVVGLFDRLDFDGSAAVNREEACQLALNTLKATMVTYGGTTMVTGAQNMYVQGTQAMYVTSNNRDINANINRRVISATNNEMTLEFGEEHFKDLRLEHDKYDPAYDDYGHPSNEWSWKKVTIGTFALPADFTYTTQVAYREDNQATKEKALGLRGYDTWSTDHRANWANWSTASSGISTYASPFADVTQFHINGWRARADEYGALYTYIAGREDTRPANAPTLSEIADLTDNGVTVEVYLCPVDADYITDVVVTRTQLMEVKSVGSDYVRLDDVEPDSRSPEDKAYKQSKQGLNDITGYNAFAIDTPVIDVKDNNYDAYNALKELKAGDKVAVVPYTADDGKTWEVGEAYAPETVSGKLADVGLYMNTSKPDGNATSITVGGTKYVINEWNLDMIDVKKAQINATRKDVTAYLAKDGTVLWTTEIGNSDAWMIVGDYYQATNSSGKVVWFAHGWTIGGEEVDIDLGTIRQAAEIYAPGDLVHYDLAKSGTGEYKLEKPNFTGSSSWRSSDNKIVPETPRTNSEGKSTGEGIYNVSEYVLTGDPGTPNKYNIHPANPLIALEDYDNYKTTTGLRTATGGKLYLNEAADSHDWNYRSTTYKDGVKFIYVSFDTTTGNVDYISVRDGVQNVSYEELTRWNTAWTNTATNQGTSHNYNWVASPAEAYVNDDGNVAAVVIKAEPDVADLTHTYIIGETVGTEIGRSGGAETSAVLDSHHRWYYQGPDFSEMKEGYFKNQHDVGDIVVLRSTDENSIMDCKDFNGGTYGDRNPDVLVAKGVAPLKSTGIEAKSKIAFYIGGGAGTVWNQNGGLLTKDNCKILSDIKIEAEDYINLTEIEGGTYAGLVKVTNATKWVDLRANRSGDEIKSLGDLLDHDNGTVVVKVLLNGKDSDGFRTAYAVAVTNAEKKDNAKVDVVVNAWSGKYGNVNANPINVTIDKDGKYVVEADAGSVISLRAALKSTISTTGHTTTWSTTTNSWTGDVLDEIIVPEAGKTREFGLKVVNYDTNKLDKKEATFTATVIVKGKGEATSLPGETKTLNTLNGFTITYRVIDDGAQSYIDAEIVYPDWVPATKNNGTTANTIAGKVGVFLGEAELTGGGATVTFTRKLDANYAPTDGGKGHMTVVLKANTIFDPAKVEIRELTTANGGAATDADAFKAAAVGVKYVGATADDTAKINDLLVKGTGGSTMIVDTGAAANIDLALSTSKAAVDVEAALKVSAAAGPNATASAPAALSGGTATAGIYKKTSAVSVTPAGNGWVTVTLSGLSALDVAYSVADGASVDLKTVGAAAAETGTIVLKGSPVSNLKKDADVAITGTVATLEGTNGYQIKVTIPGYTEPLTGFVQADGIVALGSIKIQGNVDLSTATIEVTPVTLIAVNTTKGTAGATTSWGNTFATDPMSITVHLNTAVALKAGFDPAADVTFSANTGSATVVSVTPSGTDVTVTLSKPLANGEKVTFNVQNTAEPKNVATIQVTAVTAGAAANYTVALNP